MRVPAGMVIIRLWLEVIGSWSSFVCGWEIGTRSCAHCKGAVNKTATVVVASLCIKGSISRGQKTESRRTSTEGVNDSRTATAVPSKSMKESIDSPAWLYKFDAIPQKKDCGSLTTAALSTAGNATLGSARFVSSSTADFQNPVGS
jgi:hypothetical protein